MSESADLPTRLPGSIGLPGGSPDDTPTPPAEAAALRQRSREALERSLEVARAQAAHLLETRCSAKLAELFRVASPV